MKYSKLLSAFLFFAFPFNNEIQAINSINVSGNTADAFVVNEIQVANIEQFIDPSFNFGGWVELYNPNDHDINFTDLYISDDSTQLKKCKIVSNTAFIPSKGYEVLWFGANNATPTQVNFNLDADGGTLYFSNQSGDILLQHVYPAAIARASYARRLDGGAEWGWTANATPGTSNQTSEFVFARVTPPVVDTDSKLFTEPFEVRVSIPEGAELKYTTDGSAPTENNGSVHPTGIFQIQDHTSVLRFALFQKGMLPSRVVTRSYIYKEHDYNLPIISVVTNPDYLYDDQIGIFVRGTNGKPGNGQSTPCNWNMDWERPTNIEYITTDGKMVINQEANIAASGGWSRANNPKAFKIKAKKKYEGENFLPYQVFKSKPYLKHKTWQVRGGGNDWRCRIKDAALQSIILSSGLDVEGQACQPVIHFINGQFQGLLNIREPNNKDYAYANYGWDDDEIDQFQMDPDSGYCQRRGTDEAYLEWYELSKAAKDNKVYEQICNIVDIDEYANYMAVHMYLGCGDYGHNNVKGFRPRIENGKFRMVLYDLDSAFGSSSSIFTSFAYRKNWTFSYNYDTGTHLSEEIKFVTIFLNMLENDHFRKKFIDTFCLVAGSVFEPERCNAIVDSMANERTAALALENKSPNSSAQQIKNQLIGRQRVVIDALKEYHLMKLANVYEQQVGLSSNINKGNLLVNNIPVPTNRYSGPLFPPISLQATPVSGYRFVGWENKGVAEVIPLIHHCSNWKYYDQGSLDQKDWRTLNNKVQWLSSSAPLGYYTKNGNRGIETVLDYGNDIDNKRPTYYFYNEFDLEEVPSAEDGLLINFAVDDGIVIYINGDEVTRFLMPEGEIHYYTYATQYAGNVPNSRSVKVPASYLNVGKNCIAVEVHNSSAHSSDIYFDAEVCYEKSPTGKSNIISTENNFVLPESGNYNLVACYEEIPEEDRDMSIPPVVINELSASNDIYLNDLFKKRDWIELYNTTNTDIDLAGMYLSDDRNNTHKYQIQSNENLYDTNLPAHGYKVFWADHLIPVNQPHTNFKLASEGGEVILTAEDGSWADSFIYESHSSKYTVGRYPDGNSQLYIMSKPTICASNVINTYAEFYQEPEYPVGIETVTPENQQMEVRYVHGQLIVTSSTPSMAMLRLYHVSGQCLMQQSLELGNGEVTVPLTGLRRGGYIARVCNNQGQQRIVKFIITE